MVVMVEVYSTTASPRAGGDGGSGEQAGPVVERARQLHAAGVVARERTISSTSSSFPNALDGLCTGHLSSSLVYLTLRGEAVCRSETGRNRWTSEGIKCAKTSGKGSQDDVRSPLWGKCVIPFQVSWLKIVSVNIQLVFLLD